MSEIKMTIRGIIVKIGLKKALIGMGTQERAKNSVISDIYKQKTHYRTPQGQPRRLYTSFTGPFERL